MSKMRKPEVSITEMLAMQGLFDAWAAIENEKTFDEADIHGAMELYERWENQLAVFLIECVKNQRMLIVEGNLGIYMPEGVLAQVKAKMNEDTESRAEIRLFKVDFPPRNQ